MGYPKQLIENLEKKLDKRLIEFHKSNLDIYEFGPLNSIIEDILNEYLNGDTHRDDLQEITATQRKIYRNKKARWMNSVIEDNKKYKIMDDKNPFHFLVKQKSILIEDQWKMLYGNKSMEDIANDLIEKISSWKSDKKSLLVDYPLFTTLTNNNKIKAFHQDVFLDMMKIVKDTMNGSIEEFYKPTPSFVTSVPLFSNVGFNLVMTQKDNGMYEYVYEEQDFSLTLTSGTGDVKMLDEVDLTIINTVVNYIGKDFYQTRTVHLTTGILAHAIYPNNAPSATHYQMVRERLDNISRLQFRYKDSRRDVTYNFWDHVSREHTDAFGVKMKSENIDIMLGSLLYESIVQKKMVYVTADNYNALTNQLSKLLYYTLQKERIKLAAQRSDDYEIAGIYDYAFFLKTIMFKNKKKNENIKLLKESLSEFVEKQIAVKKFDINKDTFRIVFTPLSESEKADLINEDTLIEKTIYDTV